jgi:hypothetical protein
MRRGLPVAAIAALVGAAVGWAAPSAAPPKRYYELAVDVRFYSLTDLGNDESQHRIGAYEYYANFQLRAVVVFENRGLRIPSNAAFVGGKAVVQDSRMQIADYTDPSRRRKPVCPGGGPGTIQGGQIRKYKPAPGAGTAIGRGELKIEPGVQIRWIPGCGESDFLHQHGLRAPPSVVVPAPTYARFAAGKAASLTCVDRAAHDASHPHGVKYQGEVAVRVRFAPIAAERLEQRLEKFRALGGQNSVNSLDPFGTKGKPCL